MTFNQKDVELDYELNANAAAELGTWKITMLATTAALAKITMLPTTETSCQLFQNTILLKMKGCFFQIMISSSISILITPRR